MNDVITVVGNVANDPSPQTVANGRTVTSFRLACTERRFDEQARQWVDRNTNWYTVKAWEALGVNAAASLRKGERVIVTGRLRVRRWENDDRRGTEVEINASALGHDLKWGTAAFRRTNGGNQAAVHASDGPAPAGDSPGGAAEPAPTASIGADGWALPAAEAEATPF